MEIISGAALVHEAAEAERGLQPEGDLRLHVGELHLNQLICGERTAELLAVEGVLPGAVPAELRGAQSAPADP